MVRFVWGTWIRFGDGECVPSGYCVNRVKMELGLASRTYSSTTYPDACEPTEESSTGKSFMLLELGAKVKELCDIERRSSTHKRIP